MNLKDQATILDLLIRVYSLEKMLTDKKILDKDELVEQARITSEQIAKTILEQSNYKGDISEALETIKKNQKNKDN